MHLVSKIFSSPSLMAMVGSFVKPLRMLILAPLVLTRLPAFDLDIYFLLVGASVITTLMRDRLCDVFSSMLSFAHAGADDLSPRADSTDVRASGEPSWHRFGEAMGTLARLERILVLPLLIFSVLVAVVGVMRIRPIAEWDAHVWWAVVLGVISVHLVLLQAHIEAALRGIGRIVVCYRLNIGISLGFVLVASVVVLLGGGLMGLICTQVVAGVMNLVVFRMALRLPGEARASARQGLRNPSREIAAWAWPPLWKSIIMAVSTLGIYRLSSAFVAGMGDEGSVASFVFAQNILLVLGSPAFAVVVSQFPRYSAMFAAGQAVEVVEDSCPRIGGALYIFAAGVLGGGMVLPVLFGWIGSNVPFPPVSLWFLYGGLFLVVQALQIVSLVYTRTNDMVFYRRNIAATVLALGGLAWAARANSIEGVVLAITLCHILTLNVFPLRKLSSYSGVGVGRMIRLAANPVPAFSVALHHFFRPRRAPAASR